VTMKESLKFWPIIAGLAGAVIYLMTVSADVGRMQSDHKHTQTTAEKERENLTETDAAINKRIEKTQKKVSKLSQRVNEISDSHSKLNVNQNHILKNQTRILNKIDKLETR